jgi:crotonobetainyl-CoA:carnitine CoA-transferase CaiB-like acyl-CoA transferase
VQVLDLGMVWAGPYCARLLAALGASVVKVEGPRHPDGTRLAGADGCAGVFADLNQGKLSLALDLAAADGRQAFLRLAAQADAVIENFSPRVMPNFGLDAASLARANPGLVTLAMPAFGATGPWANYVAYGSGMELVSGLGTVGLAGRPAPAPVPYLDYLAGAFGAAAVVAALLTRDRDGRGCHLEAAQREVACQLISSLSASILTVASATPPPDLPPPLRAYGDLDGAALAAEPWLAPRGLFAGSDATTPCAHFARPPWRIAGMPARAERPAPALGADSRVVLQAAGMDDARIDELVGAGIVLDASGTGEGAA